MSEKMREEFEAWVKTFNSMPAALFTGDDGRYIDDWIQCRWLGWQASRAALCVELPNPESMKFCPATSGDYDAGFDHGQSQMRDDIIDAIHAAGVKTK